MLTIIKNVAGFAGCTMLAFFGVRLMIGTSGGGWSTFTGFGFFGIAALTWNAVRYNGEHHGFLRVGAAAGNLLVLFICLNLIDFHGSTEMAIASSGLVGAFVFNAVALGIPSGRSAA